MLHGIMEVFNEYKFHFGPLGIWIPLEAHTSNSAIRWLFQLKSFPAIAGSSKKEGPKSVLSQAVVCSLSKVKLLDKTRTRFFAALRSRESRLKECNGG